MLDVLLDTILDTAKIMPFLFLTYLAMEYIEVKTGSKTAQYLAQAKKMGPMIGAVVGVVPQCGFSATASGFFAGGLISIGTLIAVYLSTSDEMLPVLISSAVPFSTILKIVSWKVAIALLTGLLIDKIIKKKKKEISENRIHEICEHEHCDCGNHDGGILRPAIRHTLKTLLFIFIITLVAAYLIHFIGEDKIRLFLEGKKLLGVVVASIIGLIPNCAASVMLTTFYVEGILGGGQLMAGLLVGAGVGLLVLFRNNRHLKENLSIVGMLLLSGIVWGYIIELLGVI